MFLGFKVTNFRFLHAGTNCIARFLCVIGLVKARVDTGF